MHFTLLFGLRWTELVKNCYCDISKEWVCG